MSHVRYLLIRRKLRQCHDYHSQSTVEGFRKNLFRIDAFAFTRVGAINLAIHRANRPASKTHADSFGSGFGSGEIHARVSACGAMTDLSIVNTTQLFYTLREGHACTNFNLFSTAQEFATPNTCRSHVLQIISPRHIVTGQ